MKNNILKSGLFISFTVCGMLPLFAGPEDPDASPDPDPLPVDGCIWILVLAAVVLGSFYLWKNKRILLRR
jgi:hypothetical protein